MKRAEYIAWAALAGLIAIFAMLLAGGFVYHFTAFWSGAMLAGGQAIVVGLALWGLRLAQQVAELREFSEPVASHAAVAEAPGGGFRMSVGDDAPGARRRGAGEQAAAGAETLDTGFQRLTVGATGIVLTGLAALSAWVIVLVYRWAGKNPEAKMPIVDLLPTNLDKYAPQAMNELCLLIGVGAALLYVVLYWVARPKRRGDEYGDAVYSALSMGLGAMIALGVGTVLAYFKVAYASEVAAIVITFFMLLEGLELFINACKNYSSIEELDQEAVDLQALPLVPMLSSIWLGGLRMLVAQSVGLSGEAKHERGVIARMMPRALLATVLIAVATSCFRVVPPGDVAVRERLGYTPTDASGEPLKEAMLQAGLHVTMPWPIDQLVIIPTEQLQTTNVGTELHASKNWKGIDFQFWTVRDTTEADSDTQDLFMTGDPGAPQILETYVTVQWRVTDPAAFYTVLSHNEFFQRASSETTTLPIYEAIVQQCTSFAVTRAFAIHSLEQIMITDRKEVEEHCRKILQEKLDSLGQPWHLKDCGIEINYLTIKDLHPPYAHPDRPNDPNQDTTIGGIVTATPDGLRIDPNPNGSSRMSRGPASAFEFVISMREFREQMIDLANGEVTAELNEAKGFAATELKKAETYRLDTVAQAQGDAQRLKAILSDTRLTAEQRRQQMDLMKQRLFYSTMQDLIDPVNKIVVDKDADVQIYQNTANGPALIPAQR